MKIEKAMKVRGTNLNLEQEIKEARASGGTVDTRVDSAGRKITTIVRPTSRSRSNDGGRPPQSTPTSSRFPDVRERELLMKQKEWSRRN